MGCDYTIFTEEDYIVVGECSFLKAWLFGEERFVPKAIRELTKILGSEEIKITDELIEKVNQVEWVSDSFYELQIRKEELIEFLKRHKGKFAKVICV